MEPVKAKLPFWLKGLIGFGAVGVGFVAVAHIGKSLVKHLIATKLEEKGIALDWDKKGIAIKDPKTGETQFAINAGGELPKDFPSDIPVFQPSTVAGTMNMGPTKTYQFQTAEPMEKVAEFYKNQMPGKGWQEDHATQVFGPQQVMTNWVKGTKTASVVATPPDEGKTRIIISLNESTGVQPMSDKEMKGAQQGIQNFMKEMNKLQAPH